MELSDRKSKQSIFPFKSLRILPYQIFTGAFNMALDYSLAQNMTDDSIPVLRFYGWQPYCLSLGHNQDSSLIDFDQLKNKGYDVVRRPTGGSAIFHSEELTYALILPRKAIDHHKIYELFHSLLTNALRQLGYGVELNYVSDHENYIKEGHKRFACFNRPAFAEVKFSHRKVVGSAQKIYRHALLQHGSILIGEKQNEIIRFLKLNEPEKIKYEKNLRERSVSLFEINKQRIAPLQIAEALLRQFDQVLHLKLFYEQLTAGDIEHAQKFVHQFKIQ